MKYPLFMLCLPFILVVNAQAFTLKEGLKIALENDKDIQTSHLQIPKINS